MSCALLSSKYSSPAPTDMGAPSALLVVAAQSSSYERNQTTPGATLSCDGRHFATARCHVGTTTASSDCFVLSPRQRPSSRTKEHRASVRTVSRGVRPASCGTSDCYGIRMVRRHCTERTDLILLISNSSQGTKEICCSISFMVRSVWPRERPSGRTTLILCIKTVLSFRPNITYSRTHCPDDAIETGVTNGAQGCFVMPNNSYAETIYSNKQRPAPQKKGRSLGKHTRPGYDKLHVHSDSPVRDMLT